MLNRFLYDKVYRGTTEHFFLNDFSLWIGTRVSLSHDLTDFKGLYILMYYFI